LPHNEQTATEVMIRLVNIIGDGLAAIALVFASSTVSISISMTLLSTLENPNFATQLGTPHSVSAPIFERIPTWFA
jgi:hypothetical protein